MLLRLFGVLLALVLWSLTLSRQRPRYLPIRSHPDAAPLPSVLGARPLVSISTAGEKPSADDSALPGILAGAGLRAVRGHRGRRLFRGRDAADSRRDCRARWPRHGRPWTHTARRPAREGARDRSRVRAREGQLDSLHRCRYAPRALAAERGDDRVDRKHGVVRNRVCGAASRRHRLSSEPLRRGASSTCISSSTSVESKIRDLARAW